MSLTIHVLLKFFVTRLRFANKQITCSTEKIFVSTVDLSFQIWTLDTCGIYIVDKSNIK